MFNSLKKTMSQNKIVTGIVAVAVVTTQASAAAVMDTTTLAFNTDDVVAVGTLVLTATAVIWGVIKAISLASRA